MSFTELKCKKVRDIVLENSATASVFFKLGIDYCNGNKSLEETCRENGMNINKVIQNLKEVSYQGIPFFSWPLDLLLDYIWKFHHRNVKKKGPYLLSMVENLKNIYSTNYPELDELFNQINLSLQDLESHFQKEEYVLFPYLYDLYDAARNEEYIEPMHCGTISNPIKVMNVEHENERQRYVHLRNIIDNFSIPEDVNFKQMVVEIETFIENLFEHIFIENNIIFPQSERLEKEWVK